MNKHYIRINSENYVIHSFTDGFEQPQEGDIFLGEGDRCWNLIIQDMRGLYNYKYENGILVQISESNKKLSSEYISKLKSELLMKCENCATSTIYEAYPLYKQINLTNDSTRAVNVISIELSKTTQFVYGEMFSLVQNLETVEELKSYKNTIDTIDFSSLVSSAPEENRPGLIQAYRTVLLSIVAQELMRSVRSWYNAKIKDINACTTTKELESISIEDCPNIS